MTDTIADMLTRIKNAYLANKDEVRMPSSKVLLAVAETMQKAGYLEKVAEEKNSRGQAELVLTLKYVETTPAVTDLKRVSKPGCRVYVTAAEIPQVLHGYGLAILSTSKGILSGSDAKQQSVGGELLAEIW
ncbi:30S ribosomal protein S8 [bacterium]|nr:30S ribosomal protein S8 [bacterium]